MSWNARENPPLLGHGGERESQKFSFTVPQLKLLATIIPIGAVLALESVRLFVVQEVPLAVQLLVDAAAVASIVIFSNIVFRLVAGMQARLRDRYEELLATQASLAIADERLRIAQEMHDGVAQLLGYVNTKIQAVESYVRRGRDEEACVQLYELAVSARQAYDDVREGIIGLRVLPRSDDGVAAVLEEFLDRWHEQSGISTQLSVDPRLHLPPLIELQLVRIIQEALTNTRKHAKATTARVDLRARDGHLAVRVEDDGIGFDPRSRGASESPRLGLSAMRERAESVGGTFEIDSGRGRGTTVRFEMPLQRNVRAPEYDGRFEITHR